MDVSAANALVIGMYKQGTMCDDLFAEAGCRICDDLAVTRSPESR
jgi:hypothetical protein